MITNTVRSLIAIAFFVMLSPFEVHAQTLAELDAQRLRARRDYDLETSRVVFERLKTYAGESPDDAARLSLAYSALTVAELQRIIFEEESPSPMQRRAMGKTIDAAAEIGLAALETLPETSEKYRIRADLYGMMIRTKYQGKKYGKKMDAAKDTALELDPDNPDAQVTGSKKLLFAKARRGGDILEALARLDLAIDLDATHEMAFILRGFAHEKLGNYKAAKADWNRALELNPLCKPAKDNLLRLIDKGR